MFNVLAFPFRQVGLVLLIPAGWLAQPFTDTVSHAGGLWQGGLAEE